MGRLIPEALYSNELTQLHYEKSIRYGNHTCDMIDYNKIWERAAETIARIDPDGAKSSALMWEMMKESSAEQGPEELSDVVNS